LTNQNSCVFCDIGLKLEQLGDKLAERKVRGLSDSES
jgi:hypothetical protein